MTSSLKVINQDRRRSTLLTILILASVATLAFFSSCSTVKKSFLKKTEQTDSISVVKKESSGVKKIDSAAQKTESGSYTRKTKIWAYDAPSDDLTPASTVRPDTSKASPILKKAGLKYYKEVEESGSYLNDEMATHSNFDSTASKEVDSAMKSKAVDTSGGQKQSSRFSLPVIIGGVFLIAFVFLVIYLIPKRPKNSP